jgi:hypothetical protein
MLRQPNGTFAVGHAKAGGRGPGVLNRRTVEIQAIAAAIVEDPEVQATLLRQARDGTLAPGIMQMLFYYAYGRPTERIEMHSQVDILQRLQNVKDCSDEELVQLLAEAEAYIAEHGG